MASRSELTCLYLIRHGRVADPWPGRVYGCLDVPLAAEGESQARRAAERLGRTELACVVSSGLARAEFGAARLRVGRDLERRDELRLREIDRGTWAGREFAQIDAQESGAWSAWQADPGNLRPPGGESLADLSERVLPALDELAREHVGRNVAVVSHSWVIRCAICSVLGLELSAAPRLELPTGALCQIDWAVAAGVRSTLAGFHLDRTPDPAARWTRGAHRG